MLYCSKCSEGGETMAGKSKYTFDSKIHVYRAIRRMTQQELADLVGVSRQTISQIERGDYSPSVTLALPESEMGSPRNVGGGCTIAVRKSLFRASTSRSSRASWPA